MAIYLVSRSLLCLDWVIGWFIDGRGEGTSDEAQVTKTRRQVTVTSGYLLINHETLCYHAEIFTVELEVDFGI